MRRTEEDDGRTNPPRLPASPGERVDPEDPVRVVLRIIQQQRGFVRNETDCLFFWRDARGILAECVCARACAEKGAAKPHQVNARLRSCVFVN